MENVEKLQDASPEKTVETPETVQQEAESTIEKPQEAEDPSVDHPENSEPVIDGAVNEESEIPESAESNISTPESTEPESSTTDANDPAPENSLTVESQEVSDTTDSPSEPTKDEPAKIDESVVAEDSDSTVDSSDQTETEEEKQPVENEDHEEEDLDFSSAAKEELLAKIREVGKEEEIRRVDRLIRALRPRFDELFEVEKEAAFKKFESEGNDPDAFEYHGDEMDKEFNALYSNLKSKRNKYFRELENQKEDNLKKKENLLEQLREVVDGEESSSSMNSVKEIQSEWKKTGPVPGAQNKTLWANYNALLDRFYDQRSIYFELKDLDRKKNLKIKGDICERAEALAQHENLKVAIVQLNELHEEYKHAGSVPRSDQEALWQRFKAASDAVYAKRKDYFDYLKVEFEANYEKKLVLANEAETFIQFDSDSISEWNKKTKEIQQLQKKWEEIGGLPRDKAKAINKQFWGSFKKFFAAKNQFFKRLESTRDENLKRKEELIAQAEELKESSDWNTTTQKYKALQEQWKEIGPVPEKVRNEVYKRFKSVCDHFFNRRRDQNSEQEKGYEENLKLKLQICDQIEAIADQDEINLDDIYDLVDNHAQLGFVPRNAIKKDRARFEEVTKKILTLEELEERDRADLLNHIHQSRTRSSPGGEKKAQRKEHSIKRKISELENDISTWNTNMEFFAASATADKLKADLQTKINEARGELENLKSQLSSNSS